MSKKDLESWVTEVAKLVAPEKIHWCDGSEEEKKVLIAEMLKTGDLLELNEKTHPNCFLHRSDPNDVARVEQLTFICSRLEDDAGPNNNWMNPAEAHAKIDALFERSMKGRTMYVIPYLMGPVGSPYARAGVEITDSPYVVLNMSIMSKIGDAAIAIINSSSKFVKGLHSVGELDPARRFIMHFPEEQTIKSFGSGYGGNALLGKKCHALRLASETAKQEGWLAEHMLILGIQPPQGETKYIAAAFPSACGKTNLAMLVPPKGFEDWKIWTVGDDIAWLHLDESGQLRAINPEAGFFGVVPGTSSTTNPNCMNTLGKNTIYTNVALTSEQEPWWEGHDLTRPDTLVDWKGNNFDPTSGGLAAHPNARFTVPASQCPSFSKEGNSPNGVPISAIVFGGRRSNVTPLVFQTYDWEHGVFAGASMASETTAAAAGQVGNVRRDPMAMKPFCGYNFGDYWAHWLSFASRSDNLPPIFHVNWFRKGADGKFLWPGFGENIRVLEWILARSDGKAEGTESAIGYLPKSGELNLDGLNLQPGATESLLAVDKKSWKKEIEDIKEYFSIFGDRLPVALSDRAESIKNMLGSV